MSESVATAGHASAGKPAMSVFERFLTFWVALCIIVGIALGQLLPGVFHALGEATVAQVNIPVAVLVWLMIVPMLLKIDLARLGRRWGSIGAALRRRSASTGSSSHSRWRVLAWIFIAHLFRPWLPADQIASYTAGLILLAAAPCTAMVFVWSNLVDGEPHFTLSQVALNDTIMVVAFAPIVGLLLGLSSITVPWDTLIPVRRALHRRAGDRGAALARGAAAAGRACRTFAYVEPLGPAFALRTSAHARAAVRPAGRTDHAPAARDLAARGADHHPGLFQRRPRLLAQPQARRRVVCGRPFGPHRRLAISSSSPWRRRSPCSAFSRVRRSRPWSAC